MKTSLTRQREKETIAKMNLRRIVLLVGATLAVLTLACSGDDDDDDATPATFTATGTSTVTTDGTAGPAATEEELVQVVEHVYPYVDQYDDYGSCDLSSLDPCPITGRLRARLDAVQGTVNGLLICRCQNTSNTRDIEATREGSGGTALVKLFAGTIWLELTIVRGDDGQLLVDDVECAGEADTSLYLDTGLGPCTIDHAADAALDEALRVTNGATGSDCDMQKTCVTPDEQYAGSIPNGIAVFLVEDVIGYVLALGRDENFEWKEFVHVQNDVVPFALPGDITACPGAEGLNIRSEPSTAGAIVQTVTDGTTLRGESFLLTQPFTSPASAETQGHGWYRVIAPAEGWVYSDFVRPPGNC
jgi:hypothetical protein